MESKISFADLIIMTVIRTRPLHAALWAPSRKESLIWWDEAADLLPVAPVRGISPQFFSPRSQNQYQMHLSIPQLGEKTLDQLFNNLSVTFDMFPSDDRDNIYLEATMC